MLAGCGEGADSVFYARRSFQVKAIDQNTAHLDRLSAYAKDHELNNIGIENCDVLNYDYPENHYDVVNCLLLGCCMKRSDFEKLLVPLRKTLKPNGIMIMSLRNYLDPDIAEYEVSNEKVEANTYLKNDDCCQIRYFIEEGRLKAHFKDFELLYYFEGMSPDKYETVSEHGDSYIICRKTDDHSTSNSHE